MRRKLRCMGLPRVEQKGKSAVSVSYRKRLGVMYKGHAEDLLDECFMKAYRGKINLVLTSPPFPLNHKKSYGNKSGNDYVAWLSEFAVRLRPLLTPKGSVVMEMGNSWESGLPVMSTLALRSMLAFLEAGRLNLCEQFVSYNPCKLPGPAQWVTVERIRVKDAYTLIWWMSCSVRPKADNRRVLDEYGDAMKRLLRTKKYSHGVRPSEHVVGERSFLRDNGGAIPSNVLIQANTTSKTKYLDYCRKMRIKPHPARMPDEVASFFIKFLTQEGDTVFDPFAGSNTTGAVAERLGRRWISAEPIDSFLAGSLGRF